MSNACISVRREVEATLENLSTMAKGVCMLTGIRGKFVDTHLIPKSLTLPAKKGLPWALAAALLAPRQWIAASYLLAYVILRLVMAWTVGVWGVRDEVLRRKLWLVPFRDAIHFAVWLASLASNRIHWGGEEFVMRKGQLVPSSSAESRSCKGMN